MIVFDVFGVYIFVRMVENLGYFICLFCLVLVVGVVFGVVFFGVIILFGCCVIGKSRIIFILDFLGNGYVIGFVFMICCGNCVYVNV